MKNLIFSLVWLIFFCLTTPLSAKLTREQIMTPDEIKAGTKAIGKTVFRGTQIETFEVEILGVLRNVYYPKKDVIVARATGELLNHTGVMQGMSGSPIYIDGKLIGALALGFGQFMKDPIFGITPITDLIEVFDRTDQSLSETDGFGFLPSFADFVAKYSADNSFQMNNFPNHTPISALEIPISKNHYDQSPQLKSLDGFRLRPLSSPVVLNGYHPKAVELFNSFFEKTGMTAMQGGNYGSGFYDLSNVSLDAGSAMGVTLIEGDFGIGATGTVTFRDGDRLAAFGHPMFLGGNVELPLSKAYAITPIANMAIAWRMAVNSEIIGTVTQDRQTAIVANIGKSPTLIPIEIHIESAENSTPAVYNCRMINNNSMTPFMFLITAFSALETAGLNGEFLADTDLAVSFANRPDLKISNSFSGESGGSFEIGMNHAILLNTLMNNPFEKISPTKIVLKTKYRSKKNIAEITAIRVDKPKVRPGETVEITAFLRAFRGETFVKTYQIQIPPDSEEGTFVISVSDAKTAFQTEGQRAPALFQPKNLDQLLAILQKKESNRGLIFQLLRFEMGATIQGQEFPSVPPSLMAVLSSLRQTGEGGINYATLIHKHTSPLEYEIQGGEFTQLRVNRFAR